MRNSYVLVAADYFTHWVEAYPIPNQEAVTVATKLVDEFFCRFSPPERLHSDQERSAVVSEVCKLLGIAKCRTTPYHPQSDGLTGSIERCSICSPRLFGTAPSSGKNTFSVCAWRTTPAYIPLQDTPLSSSCLAGRYECLLTSCMELQLPSRFLSPNSWGQPHIGI